MILFDTIRKRISRNFLQLPLQFLAIATLFIATKVFFLLRYHLPIWDEAVYLGMGKYIYSLGHSGLWEMLRPVGLPLVIGWTWKIGLPYIFASEIIAVLFGVGSILLCYLIGKKLFNGKVAVLAAALLATSPWFYLYSSYILTEVPSVFFVLASIYFFTSKRHYLCGASVALAMLFKFPNGLLLIALAAASVASQLFKNLHFSLKIGSFFQLTKVIASFITITLPFLVLNYLFYRPYTSNPFDAIFRPYILASWHQSNPAKAIASPLANYLFYLFQAINQHIVFIIAVAAVFLFFNRKWFKDSGKTLLAAYLVIYGLYFTYIPNKDERFLILFLPAICVFAAAVFFEAVTYFRLRLSPPKAKFALTAVTLLLILSFSFALYKDLHFYTWRPASEPAVVSELYKSISKLGINGAVLTSEPVFAAFNDNRFFPYYFTSYQGMPAELKALNEWELNEPFEAVIFSQPTLFCPSGDSECQAARSNMYGFLQSHYKQVFNGAYYSSQISYFIFVNESLHRNS